MKIKCSGCDKTENLTKHPADVRQKRNTFNSEFLCEEHYDDMLRETKEKFQQDARDYDDDVNDGFIVIIIW